MIYLDYNSTAQLSEATISAMTDIMRLPLNSSSIHTYGRRAGAIVDDARNGIKDLLIAQNYDLIFTSGASESNSLAIVGSGAMNVLMSPIEHSSVWNVNRKSIHVIEFACTNDGVADLLKIEEIVNSMSDGNFMLSLMLANNETGALQPVKDAAKIVHQKGGLVHTDMVQAIGKINVDIEDINADLISISAHKFGGPQGIGCLLIRKGININPIIFGGDQENGKRGGTLNVAAIHGFYKALQYAIENISRFDLVEQMRDNFEDQITSVVGSNALILSKNTKRLPNTSCIAVAGLSSESQLVNFDLNGIMVSAGSACSSRSLKPSRVLTAMGFNDDVIKSAVRISFGPDNTSDDAQRLISVWKEFYELNKKQNG